MAKDDVSSTAGAHEIVSLDVARARRFISQFKKLPFLTVLVDGDKLRIYAREDFDRDDLIAALHALESVMKEGNGNDQDEE